MPRHRHETAYLALVLGGGYEEAGDQGRRRVGVADVIAHRPFEAHMNRAPSGGAVVLNLPLPWAPPFVFGRVGDPDAIARLAERDLQAAAELAIGLLRPLPAAQFDWPDRLAADLLSESDLKLSDWARRHGLAPASVSRGFHQTFGVSPQRYRLEGRTRAALEAVAAGSGLADVAAAHGFYDQAHLSHAVRAMTGLSPTAWRKINCVQDRERRL